jgi:tRNA G18 (ribose-2'-O)-methylase SpoU
MSCENYNVQDRFKSFTLEEVQTYAKQSSLPFGVACFNVKGSLNTGTIIRTACCFSAADVFIIGPQRFDRRSLVGSNNYISIAPLDDINQLSSFGYYPVYIEQGGKDLSTFTISSSLKPCLVFGSESSGIPQTLLENAEHYSITQFGVLRSLNVSAAAAIAINHVAHAVSQSRNNSCKLP